MTGTGDRKAATVFGAGFSGLATAYFLERAGYAVTVYERAEREGGLLRSFVTDHGLVESGANAFLNSPRVEELFADLGIPLVPARRESRARFFFRNGWPTRWPLGFGATARLLGFALRYFFRRGSVTPRPRESVSAWGNRVMGEEATEYLLLPAFQGIYAGEGRRLSATLLLRTLFSPRAEVRPRIRGSVTAPGGMGEVTAELRAKLEVRGVKFYFGTKGTPAAAGLIYYCGSAAETAESLAKIDPELSRVLARIETLPLVSLTAFFAADSRIRPGFGVLFPPREGFRSLGVLYNHVIFPDRVKSVGIYSETWILGGARRPELAGFDDERILGEVLADRKRLNAFADASEAPVEWVLHRWPKAIPYYTVELEAVLEEIARRNLDSGKLRIMGNYLGGIGLTKILDRIAEEIARESRP